MKHLALIGNGQRGKQYIRSIESRKDCQLLYIASPRITSDTDISERYIKVVDYRKLLSNKEIDGVIIATPSKTHFTLASDFIKNGHNVLIEKPMTTSYRDAIKLKKLADTRKSVLMVGHLYNYNPAFQALLGLRNKIGTLRFIQTAAGKSECFSVRSSALWEWGPHDIAMCLEVLGMTPTAVSTQGVYMRKRIDYQVFLTLFFQKDVKAFLHLGWCFPQKKRMFTLTGSEGQLVFNDLEKKIVCTDHKGNTTTTIHHNTQPLQEELDEFIRSIKSKKMPQTGIEEGLDVVKILHFAEKSMMNKGKITRIL